MSAACHFADVTEDMLMQWRTAHRRVLRRNAGQSAVHAWRICSRRLFALEELLAPDPRRRRGASLHGELHQAFHASGKLRDSQLSIRRLEQLALTYSAATRLARHLRQQLPRQRRRVVNRMRAVKPRALCRVITAWREPRAADFEQLARDRAVRRLTRAARLPYAVDGPHRTSRSLHLRRIRLKSLRYMGEICRAAGCKGGQSGWTFRKLTHLQSVLGEIVDIQVLLKNIEKYGRRHHRWRSGVSPLRAHLRNQRLRLIDRLP